MAEAGLPTELQSMSPMCYGALELFGEVMLDYTLWSPILAQLTKLLIVA